MRAVDADTSKVAVLIIDVQNDYCHEEGVFAQAGNYMSEVQKIVPTVEQLVNIADVAGVLTVFVKTVAGNDPVWLSRREHVVGEAALKHQPCREGSWGAQYYKLAPATEHLEIAKAKYSAFTETNLESVLRARGVEAIIGCGVATETCVDSTLRFGLHLGFHTAILQDASASYSPQQHKRALEAFYTDFGPVYRIADIEAGWQ